MDLHAKYKQYFPEIESLYPYQEEVIKHLIEGNSTLAIISTGGGKSLIFQLLALELEGITMVVSPLIALMQEQVNELNKRGIDALALNSNIPFDEQRKILRNLSDSDIRLLYLSPERLQNGIFRASLAASGVDISMIVIDEAHCISQWGQSFRPDYAQIVPFKKFLDSIDQKPIVFALTATLAKEPRKAIQNEFDISDDNTFKPQSIIRENLNLHFIQVKDEKEKLSELEKFLEENQPEKVLVYLYSKRKCEEYAESIKSWGYETGFYHADVDKEEKGRVYSRFKNGKIQILFATTAFGMGINIPDIEAIVHIQTPNSIEEYYQHVGRGWRDKSISKTCQCLALWSETNFDRRKKEIAGEKLTIEALRYRVTNLLGKKLKKGNIISKDKEEYLNSSDNLQIVRYKLEEKGIIETIGEINGSPLKIEMNQNTDLWNAIHKDLDGLDSFQWASAQSGIEIAEIIDHLYEQEFVGNIKKMPAIRRDIFFRILKEDLDPFLIETANELNSIVAQRLADLDYLKSLFLNTEPNKLIEEFLS